MDISGTLKIAAGTESCDANRLGAIKYVGSAFYICQNASNGWEALSTSGANSLDDRITSNSQAGVIANSTGYISLTTGGVTGTVYFAPNGRLVTSEVSTTGAISATDVFASTSIVVGRNGANKGIHIGLTNGGGLIEGRDLGGTYSFRLNAFGSERSIFRSGINIGRNAFTSAASATFSVLGSSVFGSTDTSVRDRLPATGDVWMENNLSVGTLNTPSTTLHVSGTLRIADGGESCDTNRLGAIKYQGSAFYICQNASNGWEALSTSGANSLDDRITSNSQAGVIANSTGYISLTTGGVTGTVYFTPQGKLVNAGVSTTGGISATSVYAGSLGVSGSLVFRDANGVLSGSPGLWLTPSYDLVMNGNIYAANYTGPVWGTIASGTSIMGHNTYLTFKVSGSDAMRIVSNGYVGIGLPSSTTPSATLHLNNATGGTLMNFTRSDTSVRFVMSNVNDVLTIGKSGSGGLGIDQNGKIIVGNNLGSILAASTTLHVSGTLRIADDGTACDTFRLGAIKYVSGSTFQICQSISNGWEPLATASSSTPIVNTGISGSLVYRDQSGNLFSNPNILTGDGTLTSATLWVGGTYGLRTSGGATFGGTVNGSAYTVTTNGQGLNWGGNNSIIGSNVVNSQYIAITTSGTEAMRIVSTGLIGIGTTTPSATLHVYGGGLAVGPASAAGTNIGLSYSGNNTGYIDYNKSSSSVIYFRANGGTTMAAFTQSAVGIGSNLLLPSTTLHVSGTLRIADGGEACDTNRLGAIKYVGSAFYICQNASNGWEALSTSGANSLDDRITSNSQAGVIANSTGYISLTTGGVTGTVYFAPNGRLVTTEISTTGTVSATRGQLNRLNIGTTASPLLGNLLTVENTTGAATNWAVFRNNVGAANPGLASYDSGALIGYNYSGGNGETNILNSPGSLAGGIILGSWNGSAYTPNMVITSTSMVGIGLGRTTNAYTAANPSTTLHVSGTLRIADSGEACDTNRLGAIRYTSGSFSICQNVSNGWESMATGGTAVTTFTSLTDVSVSLASGSIYGPTSTGSTGIGNTIFGINAAPTVTGVGGFGWNTIYGNNAGSSIGAAYGNTALGYNALTSSTTGNVNTAVGSSALGRNTTGSGNTALGYAALNANTTASGNTAIGFSALYSSGITTGSSNTAIGYGAISSLTSGYYNVSMGYLSLFNLTTGYQNVAIGTAAIQDTTTGSNNIGIGFNTMLKNTSGTQNIGMGYYALRYNVTGSNNVAIGNSAGLGVNNNSFSGGTLLGSYAGQGLTTGNSNTLIGYNAGGGITTGINNLVLGAQTSPYSNTGSNQLNIGNAIWGNFGSGTGNANLIGINTTSPTYNFEVSGTSNFNGTVSVTSANVRFSSGNGVVWGNNDIYGNTASNFLGFTTNSAEAMRIVSSGNVGIGTGTPSQKLDVAGTSANVIAAMIRNAHADGRSILALNNDIGAYAELVVHGSNYGTLPGQIAQRNNGVFQTQNGFSIVTNASVGTGGSSPFTVITGGYNNTPAITVTAGSPGNVGIGVTDPSTSLHTIGTLRIANGGESCDANRLGAIKYQGNAFYICQNTSNGWEAMATSGANSLADRITSNSQAGVIANSTGYISLTTGGVTGTVYFAPNGRLVTSEISTTGVISSSGLFNRGNAQISFGNLTLNSNYFIGWGTGGNTITGDSTSQTMIFKTSNTEALRIVSTGFVGIGTIDPSYTLHVSGTAYMGSGGSGIQTTINGNIRTYRAGQGDLNISHSGLVTSIQAASTVQLALGASGTEIMRFNTNGNVGIGTTTPSATLHVSGTLRIANGGESCDTNRLGAIRYTSGSFSICQNVSNGWESMATGGTAVTTFTSLTDVSSSAGAGNIFGPGSLTGATSSVTNTTAFGHGALASASNSGYNNSAFGYNALANNTTGSSNVALGRTSLRSNTSGIQNTAIGTAALYSNTSGGSNLAIGNVAMYNNTTGSSNLAMGASTMFSSVGASNNIGLGNSALFSNTNGSGNVAIGGSAAFFGSVTNSVVIGRLAGQGISGSTAYTDGVVIGASAGAVLTTGSSNTLIGASSGMGLSSGSNNIAIGTLTGLYSNVGNNQLNLANAIWGNFGSGSGNANLIGININSPTTALEVSGTISATAIYIGGQAVSAGGSADRITSGTTTMAAISATSYISMTTNGTNWGYFGSTASYLPQLSSAQISSTNVSTSIITFAGVSGSAGVSLTVSGADNLGNHTATQNLAMGGFSITGLLNTSATGNISANMFIGSGAGLTDIPASAVTGLNLDRITSGTSVLSAIGTTGYFNLITSNTTWGYFSSTASYLPSLSAAQVSATNVSTTMITFAATTGSAGVSLTVDGDNLGNHTATQALDMAGFSITGAAGVSSTGNLKTTGALQSGNTDTACSASGDYGKMRYDNATKSLYLCRQ